MVGGTERKTKGLVAATIPVATAVGIFGIVYGAAAAPVFGSTLTIMSSVIIFSGAAQFLMLALVVAGATPLAVLGGVATLAMRHFPLGAVLQPRLTEGRTSRVLAAWFLLDETTGLALTRDEPPEHTLRFSGTILYVFWIVGTILGVLGGSVAAIEPLAVALFPVLFIGLAALTGSTINDAVRAVLSGLMTLGLVAVWPEAGALGAIGVAILVAAVLARP